MINISTRKIKTKLCATSGDCLNIKFTWPLVPLAFTAFLGCAAAKKNTYHFDIGARNETYIEKFDEPLSTRMSRDSGLTVTTLSGDNNKVESTASGVSIGFTETLPNKVSTRIALGISTFQTVKYTFNISTVGIVNQEVDMQSTSLDLSIGYKFKYFRPYISYLSDTRTYTVTTNSSFSGFSMDLQNIKFFGAGMEFLANTWGDNEAYISADYRAALNLKDGKATQVTIQSGLRF